MAEYVELSGRTIDDIEYTGLIESLTIVGLIAAAGIEASEHLEKEHLLDFLKQIQEEAAKAQAFAGVTAEEAKAMSQHLMKGMRIEHE